MLCRVAFFTLLVLSLVQEDCCYPCEDNAKNLGKDQIKILTLIDYLVKGVLEILEDDEEHKKIVQIFKDKVQAKICTLRETKGAVDLALSLENCYDKMKKGLVTKGNIYAFLQKYPLDKLDAFLAQL
ncbi:hypothetical protein XELAEV_18034503mg [Xenopus laevis]|uniref:Uncharacterized protein n=1 Tax=Xenopus laevis TaxID=8355 RepID=A0A974CE40_XENLA|nr:hypothetical protein XELAEV_18034503mg [Xenopus laevis]